MVMVLAGPVLVAAVVAGVLLALTWLRLSAPRRAAPEDETDQTPLEKAQEAIGALSPDDRERCRQWLETRWPPPRRGDQHEGIRP
jgi:hypothetical protein